MYITLNRKIIYNNKKKTKKKTQNSLSPSSSWVGVSWVESMHTPIKKHINS